MDPAQAPTPASSPQTGVTAALPTRLGVPPPVPPPPEIRAKLFQGGQQDASEPQPAADSAPPKPAPAASNTGAAAPEQSPLLAAWPRSALVTMAFLLGVIAALLVWHFVSASAG